MSVIAMALKIFGKQAQPAITAPSPHTFLCLMFVNHSVQAALWKIEGEEVVTLANSALLTFEDNEDGLIKIDQVLQELGSESENVNQVVFGFDPHWVNDDGLKAEKKDFIKDVTTSLGLDPVGFVVITDALVQQILSEDSMASQVLVYLQDDLVSIFLIKQGKQVDQLAVGRSEDIVQDIVEGLARFNKQLGGKDSYLPAKLVLASPILSTAEVDDAQQQIRKYNWSDNHPFVQAPIVESMVALDVLTAVVSQGGIAVAESKGLKGKQHQETVGAEDFGFESVDSPVAEGDNFASPLDGQQATSFGIPINEDSLPPAPVTEVRGASRSSYRSQKKLTMPNFFRNLWRWYTSHPHQQIIKGGILAGLLALIVGFFGWVAFGYQVELNLQLAEKVIAKDLEITIDPTISQSNPAKQILKAELETLEVSGSEVADTTGVKAVGDSATGTVTLFNKTTSPKTFTAGTALSTGAVAFTLDDEVTVASASSEESGGQLVTTFGQEDAAVTASGIGAEGNIGSGTELTVASFASSTYAASAKETFSGGSSREVRVIAADDQEELLATLTDSLLADAAKKFSDKAGNGTYYVLTSSYEVTNEEYSGEAGDEADQLSLDLTLVASAAKYNSADIRPLLEAALADDIPEGYVLVEEEPEFLSSPKDNGEESEVVVLETNVITKARPPFDEQNVIDSILGLKLDEFLDKLMERPEINQATYSLKPGIASWFVSKVPQTAERIIVKITN